MRQLVYTIFISNNCPSFHLGWKKNLVKHRKVSKYYETDRDWGGKVFIWNKPPQRLLAGSPELCKSKTLDLQKHQNHQTKQTLKEKNWLGKGTNKSCKPNTPQNFIHRMKVIPNKNTQFAGKRIRKIDNIQMWTNY